MVNDTVSILDGFETDIRDTFNALKSLNGTHGFVSTKSHESVQLTTWSLQRLEELLHQHNYDSLNMLSMMTLSVSTQRHMLSMSCSAHYNMQRVSWPQFRSPWKENFRGLLIISRARKGVGIHHLRTPLISWKCPSLYQGRNIQQGEHVRRTKKKKCANGPRHTRKESDNGL